MTAKEISERLAGQALSVVRYLLPSGKLRGREWVIGNAQGDSGDSLSVCISGDKSGVWQDFATGEGGDLLDLWCVVKRVNLGEAIRETKNYLGISEVSLAPVKQYQRPAKPKCKPIQGEAHSWLTNTRKLSEQTIKDFRLACEGENIILPYLRDDELVMCKWRSIRDKKTAPTSSGQEPCLFGWQALDPQTRFVVITEGEFDAMSFHEYGVPALSVPFGGGSGGKQNWIESEFDNLDRFDVIYVCFDSDEPGRLGAQEVIKRLGNHRCRLVHLPEKDANDCLVADISTDEILRCLDRAVSVDPSELKSASNYGIEVVSEIYPEDNPSQDDCMEVPWPKARDQLQFRKSELIMVTGINGHGKSQLVGHFALEAIRQGERVCIASMEMAPGRLLGRLTRQACGLIEGRPQRGYIDAVMDWYAGKLWMFSKTGSTKVERLLEVFEYAVNRYQIKVFIIDSLMMCGLAEDDYNGQKEFISKLCDFRTKHNCTIFLVSHPRKTLDENRPPNKMDVAGSASLTNLVDTLIICWKNKSKLMRLSDPQEDDDIVEIESKPDAIVTVEKQRNHNEGWEGKIALWFCKNSHQFLSGPDQKPFQYVQYSQRLTA